jgi:myo-inositol-hexaphosphate 3-phosphohydrolase
MTLYADIDGRCSKASSAPLGSFFPKGLLVVHDHSNPDAPTSNFKFIDWDEVARSLDLPR